MSKLKPTTFPKRTVFRVEFDAPRKAWVFTVGRMVITQDRTQRLVLGDAVNFAECLHDLGRLAQIVVHGKDGRIKLERTYPRSSDPRRTKG